MAAGLPFLPPYKKVLANFRFGVNFAVAGATVLPWKVLAAKHIFPPITNSSLNVQLAWMSSHFNSIWPNHREIGGNDYNYGFYQGKTVDELTGMVPEVVDAIMNDVRKVISFGATRIVDPGNFPIGCLPMYKTAFQTNTSTAYDKNQCWKHFNEFAMYHNKVLQQGIDKLKQESPNVVIVYGHYYKAYQFLLKYAKSHGKSQYANTNKTVDSQLTLLETQRACCGVGGTYIHLQREKNVWSSRCACMQGSSSILELGWTSFDTNRIKDNCGLVSASYLPKAVLPFLKALLSCTYVLNTGLG